ncbi:unnamed protein product [Oikopleura dioica]|uniref:E3 ubiquitin-protein ligase KCMF1 n=1 Tax=Oikopleura dioica TaxID=34765 RepID=E4X732_OIKDI|nr:unnamed protein product [Oikopleura dioica]
MSRHESVSCDNCLQNNFEGIRYKCLICHDYDLCERCYSRGAATGNHRPDHPMQSILTHHDSNLYHRGDSDPDCYTCPYCGQFGFKLADLATHIATVHRGEVKNVLCPVCAVTSSTEPNRMFASSDDLLNHLDIDHVQPFRSARNVRSIIRSSRGGSRPNRNLRSSAIPIMDLVSNREIIDLTGLNPMIDDPAIRNLIMDITRRNTTVRPERASSPSRAQNSQAQSKKHQSEAVSTSLLLDNLSEEEDSSSEEAHEKGVFFQDLLLSTLTDRRLNLVTYSQTDEAESESDGGFGADSEYTLSRKMRRKAKEANIRKKAASGESLPLENNNNPDSEA